jgi:hypothetical protein
MSVEANVASMKALLCEYIVLGWSGKKKMQEIDGPDAYGVFGRYMSRCSSKLHRHECRDGTWHPAKTIDVCHAIRGSENVLGSNEIRILIGQPCISGPERCAMRDISAHCDSCALRCDGMTPPGTQLQGISMEYPKRRPGDGGDFRLVYGS